MRDEIHESHRKIVPEHDFLLVKQLRITFVKACLLRPLEKIDSMIKKYQALLIILQLFFEKRDLDAFFSCAALKAMITRLR